MNIIHEDEELNSPEYYKKIYDDKIKEQQQLYPLLKRQSPRGPKLGTKFKFEEHSEEILSNKKKDLKLEDKLTSNIKNPSDTYIKLPLRIINGLNTEIILNRQNIDIKNFILNNFSSICCLNKYKDIIFNYDILHKKELRRDRFKYNYKVHLINHDINKIILKTPLSFFVIDIVEFIIERNINQQINNIIKQNICPNFIKCFYATKNNLLINKLENTNNETYEKLPIFSATEFYDGSLSELFYKLKKIYIISQNRFVLKGILKTKIKNISNLSITELKEIGINLEGYSEVPNLSLLEIIECKLYNIKFEQCKLKDILNVITLQRFKKFTDLLNECSLIEIITYIKDPLLNTDLSELIYSILFQLVVGIYYLNTKMNTMIRNLMIQDIVYKDIDRDIIFKYTINGEEYYIKTFGFLIAYSDLSKCLNAEILSSEYINTCPNLEHLKDVYTKYKNGNYNQFQNLKILMTELKYKFVEPYEVIEHLFERTFGAYKHYIRKLYYKKVSKDIQSNENFEVEKGKIKKSHWKENTEDIIERMKLKREEIKNNALYEISKYNLDAFTEIAKYLKCNTYDITTVNNLYRETFRNKYYTDEKIKELYPFFYDNFVILNNLISELVNIKNFNHTIFKEYFSVFKNPLNGKISNFNLDKQQEFNFIYDKSITINKKLLNPCIVDLFYNYELSIPLYTNCVFPTSIRITKNINKIYAFSDIHGDIMPLIVNLRDCSSVIRKKEKNRFNKLSIPDYDAICELNKTHEKLYSNVEKNIRYDGKDKYIDDLNYEWCGDNSIVVICGDYLDNGRQNLMNFQKKINEFPMEEAKILMFINAINKQAMIHGGRIFKLLGNHEEMNMSVMWKENKNNYIISEVQSNFANASGEDEIENYPRINNVPYELEFLSNRQRFFLPSKPGALLLAEDGIFILLAIKNFIFVHGGISNEHITIENINFINNFINYYLVKGDIYKDLLYDINLSKNDAFIICELLIKQISISRDHSFGYINNKRSAIRDSSTKEQCEHLQDRLNIIFNDLKKYICEKHEKIEINPGVNRFLEENFIGNAKYSNCIGNFWFGINDDIKYLDNNLNFVMGHLWQYNIPRYSEDNKLLENINISINDFNLTKEYNITDTFIEYGIREHKEYNSKKNDPPIGMTSSCLFKKRNFPSLYRLDVSTSRAFNDIAINQEKKQRGSTDLEGQHFRFPQALCIVYTNNDYSVYLRKTHFDIIKIHLPTLNQPNEILTPIDFYNYIVKYVKYKEEKYREKYGIKKTSVYS